MLSPLVEQQLNHAIDTAQKERHEFVSLEHLLLALSESPRGQKILTACGVKISALQSELNEFIAQNSPQISSELIEEFGGDDWRPDLTIACHRLFQRAAIQTQSSGQEEITVDALLVALFHEKKSHAVYLLEKREVSQFDIINYISHGVTREDFAAAEDESDENSDNAQSPLAKYTVNLNEKARNGQVDPLIGRQDIINRCLQILSRRTKNNPLLIGDPGVGKTAIADGLALQIVEGHVPETLKASTIYSLDMGNLIAGTKFRGEFEGRLKGVINELAQDPHSVLFIDEIHTIVGAGATSGGSMDASNLLKPALADGKISCIGSTTFKEFRQHFERDQALARRFQKIEIKEPSVEETVAILKGLQKSYENFHGVHYSEGALKAAAELSAKYIHHQNLPDKAIDIIDEVGAKQKLRHTNKKKINIRAQDVEKVIAEIAQVPIATVTTNEKKQLQGLESNLKGKIFGQNVAIEKLVQAIKLASSGLGEERKPIGSFLFSGPTGVGKTEVSKQLAHFLGTELIRFDMSEYMEKHTVARLVGAPPGYVGYEEGGLLTEAIHRNPYAVLLLDEMEKAHPDIFNLLLQVMDGGRLTDSNGRTADFTHAILIMTSNAGAQDVAKGGIGIVPDRRGGRSLEAIKKAFSPEFLNRLDAVVSFDELPKEVLFDVISKFLDELNTQLKKKKVQVTYNKNVLDWLFEKGYDPAYGARPFHRVINEHIKKPIVDEILFGEVAKGGTIEVTVKKSALHFDFLKN